MKKKISCLILTLITILSLVPCAAASNNEATEAAESLYELGLFKGTGTSPDGSPVFALDKMPTRNQAIIMLVRLLGKENEALAGSWTLPFTDVPVDSIAYPYIGYAYANGLTNGYTKTTYCGTNPIRANQYITFVLRALKYESGKDFEVATAWTLSDQLGITNHQYSAANTSDFLRGDVAQISRNALTVELKDSHKTLAEKLIAEDVFTEAQYARIRENPSVSEVPEIPPYTVTAFGDQELHTYLASQKPDEMILWNSNCFDLYVYNDRFIGEDLRQTISGMYPEYEVKESCTQLKGIVIIGTRVECINNEPYGRHINIQTFTKDKMFYEITLGMSLGG